MTSYFWIEMIEYYYSFFSYVLSTEEYLKLWYLIKLLFILADVDENSQRFT